MNQAAFELAKVSKGATTIVLNDELANQLLDVLEAYLDSGDNLPPAVYAFGEKLCHRIEPTAFFGVERGIKTA